MEKTQRATMSLALIVLICFFLPWVQISCGASEGTLSGVDLARDGRNWLWLIPVLMVAILFLGLVRGWKEKRELSAIVTLIGGLVSSYLINRERVRADNSLGLIAIRPTGWLWLGFGSAILLVILSALRIVKRASPRGAD